MADSNQTLTPESVIQTYQRAKERRRLWESHWNIFNTPPADIPPDMWDLLKLGVGGYVVGRSAEKSIKTWKE